MVAGKYSWTFFDTDPHKNSAGATDKFEKGSAFIKSCLEIGCQKFLQFVTNLHLTVMKKMCLIYLYMLRYTLRVLHHTELAKDQTFRKGPNN